MNEPSSITEMPSAMLTACPQCGHFVRLPAIVSLSAHVRCPICQHGYALRSVLPADIPGLELISCADAESNSPFSSTGTADSLSVTADRPVPVADRLSIPEVLQRGAKRRGRRRDIVVRTDDRELVAEGSSLEAEIAPTDRRDYPQRAMSRRRRSTNQSSLEVAKVVIGALLALPAAQLIIWWGLGLDPFRMGPGVGRYVPFIVPSRLAEDDSAD